MAEAARDDYTNRASLLKRLLALRSAYRAAYLGGADYDIGLRAVKDGLALEGRNPDRMAELAARAEMHLPYAVARTKAARYARQMAEGTA